MLVGKRYELLELLGKGGMGAVYRAYDRLTRQQVALKRVERTADGVSTTAPTEDNELRAALAQEFRVLSSLRHPNIVSVLDYGFDEYRLPYFTMELLEGARPIDEAAGERPRAEQVDLMLQMLQALVYLHRHGILHRDLKPSNVLVIGQVVKVLDFGLALFENNEDTALGTLPYMAPEILYGHRADERADLYAVGLVIFEMCAGAHPFENSNRQQLLNNILTQQPDLSPLESRLLPIVERLLQKEPRARYGTASEVIAVLREAFRIEQPLETSATRESFLQAARMVGRENEREQLDEALTRALRERGSVWLVGGESGVGKSRLLEEVRTAALVRGAQVVRGKTLSEGATPYSLWQEPLRYLALISNLEPLAASTLKPIIPDIALLLGRPVDDPPKLDPDAALTRLLAVLEMMLRELDEPLTILLEDLHLAGEESLALLSNLARIAPRLRLLVIGSYRDDEKPTLPEQLPLTNLIVLPRLKREDIGELSVAMLGQVGNHPGLIELLERETQGNLFFIVEVVRALAEEAGELANVTEVNLQRRVLTGGVRTIVQRRLNRITGSAREVLTLAAAVGRQIDLELLAYMRPDIDLYAWVNQCAHIVLAAQGETWIFAHDKLRETLIDEVTPQDTRTLHRQIAEAIESIRSPLQSAGQLAYHWAAAGNPAKEGHFAQMAGEQAYRNGAWNEAFTLLARAYSLRNVLNLSSLEAGRLQRLQADACYKMGKLIEAREHLRLAAQDLDWSMPDTSAELSAKLMREVIRQVSHRLFPWRIQANEAREWLLETHRVAMIEAEIAFLRNETTPMLVYGIGALNQAEAAGISPELARGSANMCYAVGNVGQRVLASVYKRQARKVADLVGDPSVQEFALRRTSLLDIGLGKWDDVQSALESSLQYATALGDLPAQEESLDFLAGAYYYQAEFERSRDLFAEVQSIATRTSNLLHQSWGMLGQAQSLLRLGSLDQASKLLKAALAILEQPGVNDLVTIIQAYGLLAITQAYRGYINEADALVVQSLDRLGRSEPTGFALLEGFAGSAEADMMLIESIKQDDATRADLLTRAAQSVERLNALAKSIPIARPRAQTLSAWLAHLQGDSSGAQDKLAGALKTAEDLKMPFEAAFAHHHTGRLLPLDAIDRPDHLGKACALFTRLGCKLHLELSKKALDQSQPVSTAAHETGLRS